MKLRSWQSECVELALQSYRAHPHFLCLATPGAGKSAMSAELAARLYQMREIDFVLCFAPSVEVTEGLARTFQRRIGKRFDGRFGAIGEACTYQSMLHRGPEFWQLLKEHRVLVVFDEVHHCAGTDLFNANSWGEQILLNIQEQATYTLALTGTPWRSDRKPIVLSRYISEEIQCDYRYGLRDAVRDGVCRKPNIVLFDNNNLVVDEGGERSAFDGIASMLSATKLRYSTILQDHAALRYCLGQGCRKLSELRTRNPKAGGLVVASSVSHAHRIAQLLRFEFGQAAVVVTYKEDDTGLIIDSYRHGQQEWIVSVGMVSEGTDIPRIQVSCHLSSTTTELYFRQILGRGIRMTPECDGETWLYTFAEPRLQEWAERIAEDLPGHEVLFKQPPELQSKPSIGSKLSTSSGRDQQLLDFDDSVSAAAITSTSYTDGLEIYPTMEFLGAFRHRLCELSL
ncbi:DEAD/DEAH box helicase family protein [Ferrimonas balearica]|uniref:DEAD/DEAH box helicase n=1 Tax=Ferrimonas balearica TaxID=44012 RepID=UPI001C574B41|nr:DEAD/DEAH box helicase family protein [Ferrimonas balearica]MBW3139626.1 DEAD/DEAH box helicase family protein [Ferrimonas balearica]